MNSNSSEDEMALLKALQNNKPLTPSTMLNNKASFQKGDQTKNITHVVVIKNFELTTPKNDITTFFRSCGKLKNITIPKGQRNPGNAYVEFSSKRDMELALLLSGGVLNGRKVYIFVKGGIKKRKF